MSHANRVLTGISTGLLALGLAGCNGTAAAGTGSAVASVNGEAITREAFDQRLEASAAGKQTLNTMVQGMLIDQYGKDNHIDVSDADVKAKEDEIRSKYPPGQFDMMLKQQNLTDADVQKILRQQLILEKAVGANIHVTDAQIQDYLAKNHQMFDTAPQVRARHILVADKATADTVEAKLKSGAKFEDLAKQYSTDPSSKVKGGELGFFTATQMVKPFSDAAFSQPIGVVGPPVKSPFGWHIIEVEEKKPGSVATFDNSKDKIKAFLVQQQEQQQIQPFLQGLRAKANIQIFDDNLKDAVPPAVPPAAATPAK
jgi:foldase protein PrsA